MQKIFENFYKETSNICYIAGLLTLHIYQVFILVFIIH